MIKSMFSGVAGLKTHQTQMDVIGNNIANVNTNGFKGSRAVFRDMFYRTLTGATGATNTRAGSNPSQVGIGVQVSSVDVINTNGGRVTTNNALDSYIDGEGYFIVSDGAGNQNYTRLGRFDFDADGNLVDGNGKYVLGYLPKDTSEYLANLDDSTINFGEPALAGYKMIVKKAAAGATAKVEANAKNKTITITIAPDMDKDGKKAGAQGVGDLTRISSQALQTALRGITAASWGTTTPPTHIDPDTGLDTGNAITYTNIKLQNVDGDSGATNDFPVVFTTSTISEVTDCNTADDPAKINYASIGSLTNISIDASGTITGTDKEAGRVVTIGRVALATFDNANALTLIGSSYYATSNNSGNPNYTAPGEQSTGNIQGSSLEGSNVDLANEFSQMILTQRGFQANSKIITVSDTMLEELINLKR